MLAPYSGDLRDRVAAALAAGASTQGAATRFEISVSTAIRWAQRLRAEGHAQPRAMGGDHRSCQVERRGIELVARQPDLTLQEIRGALAAACGVTVGLTSLSEQDRSDVAEARRVFIRRQPALDTDHLVFIDDTWAEGVPGEYHDRVWW